MESGRLPMVEVFIEIPRSAVIQIRSIFGLATISKSHDIFSNQISLFSTRINRPLTIFPPDVIAITLPDKVFIGSSLLFDCDRLILDAVINSNHFF
jgi:hypothetical protein